MKERFMAYDGNEPFIFVSYAHRDSDRVYEIISRLHEDGYCIWYDEGIPVASDYGEVLYNHVQTCAVFLLFVSHASVNSEDVKKEATHAISFGKNIIQIVFDEDAELPPSLAYHLPKTRQYLTADSEPNEFYRKLTAALSICKGGEARHTPETAAAPKVERKVQAVTEETPASEFEFDIDSDGVIVKKYNGDRTRIVIPSEADGYPVTGIGNEAFYKGAYRSCNVEEVIIPDGVTFIGNSAFYGCDSLENITIPDSVTSIGYDAFNGCSSLTEVTIPNSVIDIGYGAFSDCDSLTEITIPDSVTSIGNYAFNGCSSLTEITIPDSVESIGEGAFSYCEKLERIDVSDGNSEYESIDGVLFNSELTKLVCYPGGREGLYAVPEGVTSIGDCAFRGCRGITKIYIPNSVTSIGKYAFCGCSSLIGITIPNSVTSIGAYAFRGCGNLTGITIPNSVTSIGYGMFDNCTSLTGITIPNSVTSIGAYAFIGCSSLTGITIPNSVTSIEWKSFAGCSKLRNITIPKNVKHIGFDAFYGCKITVTAPHRPGYYKYKKDKGIKWKIKRG